MSILIKGHKMPDYCDECPVEYDGMCRLCSYADTEYHKRLDDCPLVAFDTDDVAPVVHAHWIEELGNVISCRCSRCDRAYNLYEDDINGYPYCAWCGAKMDEREGESGE